MPVQNIKGLEGLKGLNSLPEATRYATLNNYINQGLLPKGANLDMADRLYRNKLFADEFGKDTFMQIPDAEQRDLLYKNTLADRAFYQTYNPFFDDDENSTGPNGELYDASKGMGRDFFKYNRMSADAKLELLESGWLNNSEINAKIEKDRKLRERSTKGFLQASAGAPTYSQAALGAYVFAENAAEGIEENTTRKHNDKIIEDIWARDLRKKTSELSPIVDQYYMENISPKDDNEIRSMFMEAIKPKDGAAHIYSAYFNDNGDSSEEETSNFSIDDMRRFLAKKAVYDYYLGPDAGYDALNNEGKEYINDHQSAWTYTGLLLKDVGISAASYTADKWNSVRRMGLMAQDAIEGDVNVWLTNDGKVVSSDDSNIQNKNGQYFYTDENGQIIPVHQQQLSRVALDDLGYNSDGNQRGWWNNQQFWTNAEQYGTMDEEEQAQYKKLGYSPYKVVYKPGDETDIFYETFKMTSFGLADMAASIIPVWGEGAALAKAATSAGRMVKAMSATGKALGVYNRYIAPTMAATGIGNAYGRGVFGESFEGNMQKIEQSVADQAQREVHNLYTNDEEYKKNFDAEVEQRYQELQSEYKDQIAKQRAQATDGRSIVFDNSDNPAHQESLRSRAMQEVIGKKTKEWEDNYKASDVYGKAIEEAAESASSAALTSSITTGLKYAGVNMFGYRSFLFKTGAARAAAKEKLALKGVEEVTNAAGKKRLASKFDFLTSGEQLKQVGKVAGKQFWGGAWTNATDELQSAGGRQMNEDRISQFISGMYDGKALETRYGVTDAIDSYFQGAVGGLTEGNTYKAGLVGGLGSVATIGLNVPGMLSIKQKGKTLRESWDELSTGEKFNAILTNGILSEYYAKKQGQTNLKAKVDLINKMLDESEDFAAIDNAIALDMATIDANNPEDVNALTFLKGVQVIDALNRFKEDKEMARVGQESSVMQKAMTTIEKLSDPSKLTDEERADFLSQYYAANPGKAQSEQQNQVALQELQQRAQKLQEASDIYNNIESTLEKVEQNRGTKLPKAVRGRLVQRLTFDRFLTDRTAELEEKITGSKTSSTGTAIESYGNIEYQKAHRDATEHLIKSIEKDITEAESKLADEQKKMDDYNSNPQVDQGFVKKSKIQDAIDNARIQVEYLKGIQRGLTQQIENLTEYSENVDGKKVATARTSDRVLLSDEILRLNPQDRARMLDKNNYNKYSDKQKIEIDKLRNDLMLKDPSLLDDIQNQAMLTQKIEANKAASAMMLENPEAAAYQLEIDSQRQLLEARTAHFERGAAIVNDAINKVVEKWREKGDETLNDLRGSIYRNLRVLNKPLLEYIKEKELDITGYGRLDADIDKAIEWTDITTDVGRVTEQMNLGETVSKGYEKAFVQSIDRFLDSSNSKEEFLDKLNALTQDSNIDDATKAPYTKLLNDLEQLWNQRESTSTVTKEEKETAEEKKTEQQAERDKRIQEAEEAARLEAERKTAEEATKPQVTDKDADTSNDRTAELAAQGLSKEDLTGTNDREAELAAHGLTEKDLVTNNEATLTPEQIAQAIADENGTVEFESPSAEEERATNPDKVELRDIPQPDTTEQGNLMQPADALQGNTFFRYDPDIRYTGVETKRQGANPNDTYNSVFGWLDSEKVDMQRIVDDELGDIAKVDPEVHIIYTNPSTDKAMQKHSILAVEYTPEIKSVHNDDNGGVITANGKQYLMIGILGYNGPVQKAAWSHANDNRHSRMEHFNQNPSERFFVDQKYSTKLRQIGSGWLTKQLSTDSEVKIRPISELVNDPVRNPKGLSLDELKWGIQYPEKLATVNVSDRNTIYPPRDREGNVGSVFLLVEASSGNYIPAYIEPKTFTEINDGKLKTQIEDTIRELNSPDYATRLAAVKKLRYNLNLSKEGDWILVGTENKPTVSIQKDGIIQRTFDVTNPNFMGDEILRAIRDLDPRINVTTSVLSDLTQLQIYDEAGALNTDIAKIGTSNASFTVYAMGEDGKPVTTTPVENPAPSVENSDLVNSQRGISSERYGSTTYRKGTDGNWRTSTGQVVADPRLVEQLNYRNLIRTKDLKPNKVIGNNELFILNSDESNPVVVSRKLGTNMIALLSKEVALKYMDQINTEAAEKARQNRVREELEREESNDNALMNLSEEEKQRIASEGEDVDLGLGGTLTEEQIVEQLMGNFEAEATPQQKTAEELVEKIASDTSDIQLSDDGSTYVDSTGKHYARVTSVIFADEFSDGRFEKDNPWGLPSTTIGTGIDEFVRDYFDNKLGNMNNLAERYPNATNEQLQEFAKQLDELKESFKRRGLTIVPRDVTVTGTVEVTDRSREKKVLDVAGTLDLLAYDRDGNFYIFDMKTNRSAPTGEAGRKKGAKWSKQLTLYKQLLQEKYGTVVKGLEIIPIQVSYPAPKGWGTATTEYTKKGGQLYANGKEYRSAEPMLHDNIPLPETVLRIDYSKLTPPEQAMVRTVENSKPSKDKEVPVVQPEPLRRNEDINGTGTRSLAELQNSKKTDTALSIMSSKEYGKRARALLKAKFPDMPKKTAELERFLESKKIPVTGIPDVELWLKMIEECK